MWGHGQRHHDSPSQSVERRLPGRRPQGGGQRGPTSLTVSESHQTPHLSLACTQATPSMTPPPMLRPGFPYSDGGTGRSLLSAHTCANGVYGKGRAARGLPLTHRRGEREDSSLPAPPMSCQRQELCGASKEDLTLLRSQWHRDFSPFADRRFCFKSHPL